MLINPGGVRFSDMADRYVINFKNHGINEIKSYTKKNLRRNIIGVFGSRSNFVMSDDRKLILYRESLSIEELVRQNDKLKNKLQELQGCASKKDIRKSNLKINSCICLVLILIYWKKLLVEGIEDIE